MVIHEAAKQLTNSETPLLDARVLLSYAVGMDSRQLFRPLMEEEKALFDSYIFRRKNGEPVAYIVGEKEFMGLNFKLNKDTLIPRPDTETIVEYLIEKFKGSAPIILDLCCGSGCIGISLCKYIDGASAVLADISQGALLAAKENAELHMLNSRCSVIPINVLKEDFPTGFDIIVSNPPYIPSNVVDGLEVAKSEPRLALDGGISGLIFYEAITPKAYASLNSGGVLAFEIGYDQADSVSEILEKNGFINIVTRKDYGGNFRLVSGEKNAD